MERFNYRSIAEVRAESAELQVLMRLVEEYGYRADEQEEQRRVQHEIEKSR